MADDGGDDYDKYYEQQLERGLEFQDFATRVLYQIGIVVVGYASRRFQIKYGENLLGAEIKRDDKFRETGNLYIELAEKSRPRPGPYVQSGIMREDNSWLFIIGDEQTLWIFGTKQLRRHHARWREVKSPTSIGRLMPIKDADTLCDRRLDVDGAGRIIRSDIGSCIQIPVAGSQQQDLFSGLRNNGERP